MEGVELASIFPFCSSAADKARRKRLRDASFALLAEHISQTKRDPFLGVRKAKRKGASPRAWAVWRGGGHSHRRAMGLRVPGTELGPRHRWRVPPAGGAHLRWAPRPRSPFLRRLLLFPVSHHIPRADPRGRELLGGAGSDLQSRGNRLASVGLPAPLKSNLAADSWHFSPNTAHLSLPLILIEI